MKKLHTKLIVVCYFLSLCVARINLHLSYQLKITSRLQIRENNAIIISCDRI